MLITGRIKEITREPYQAFVELEDINVPLPSLSLSGLDENFALPIDEHGILTVQAFVWLVNDIEVVPKLTPHSISQPYGKNGTVCCGLVTELIDEDEFVCEVECLDTSLRVCTESNVHVTVGDTVKFKGEMHAEI